MDVPRRRALGSGAARAEECWLPDLTLHGGRHSFVTLLAKSRVPIDAIEHAADHSSITITIDRHRHPAAEGAARTASTFQAYLDGKLPHGSRDAPEG